MGLAGIVDTAERQDSVATSLPATTAIANPTTQAAGAPTSGMNLVSSTTVSATSPTVVCDDADDDLAIEVLGDGGPALDRPWLEVVELTFRRDIDFVEARWTLGAPVPADIGSAPGFGDFLASWTLVLETEDLANVALAIDKEGAEPLALYSDGLTSDGDFLGFDNVEGPELSVDGSVLTATFPIDRLDHLDGELGLTGASEMRTTIGDVEGRNFFDGVDYFDEVCG